jgi:class 3 adenylate cyclase
MRVPRTFTFVDLSGFTNYTAERGDDEAARLLARFRAVVREVASSRGVRVAKWLGDGCMIVSISQSDSVAAALDLEARAEVVCAPLALRVGIATGLALLFEGDDYIGSAVNMAARLCDATGPNEVLIAAEQIEELPVGVVATSVGSIRLAGFAEPIAVVELSGIPEPAVAHDTGELWTRSPFVA